MRTLDRAGEDHCGNGEEENQAQQVTWLGLQKVSWANASHWHRSHLVSPPLWSGSVRLA
jgi:hypothetical protein